MVGYTRECKNTGTPAPGRDKRGHPGDILRVRTAIVRPCAPSSSFSPIPKLGVPFIGIKISEVTLKGKFGVSDWCAWQYLCTLIIEAPLRRG